MLFLKKLKYCFFFNFFLVKLRLFSNNLYFLDPITSCDYYFFSPKNPLIIHWSLIFFQKKFNCGFIRVSKNQFQKRFFFKNNFILRKGNILFFPLWFLFFI